MRADHCVEMIRGLREADDRRYWCREFLTCVQFHVEEGEVAGRLERI
jgi:hypothetical protein